MTKKRPPLYGGKAWKPGRGANRDPKLSAIRRGMTDALNKYGLGGLEKTRVPRRKPGMPKMPWDTDEGGSS